MMMIFDPAILGFGQGLLDSPQDAKDAGCLMQVSRSLS